MKQRARRLAELGYVAFALDYVGDGVVLTDRDKSLALVAMYNEQLDRIRSLCRASLDILRAQPETDPGKLAAIGYCFGGGVVLEMARCHPELACVVAFHPGLANQPEHDDRKIRPKVMVCAGVHDPLIPTAARERFIALMNEAQADWQLLTYGNAGHSFTDRTVDALGMAGFFHHAPTDRRSWAAMRDLFDEALGRP